MTITYQDVGSSNIRALGWANGVGYVWFTNGRRFAYKMDRDLFDKMHTSASIGGFFSRMVKGKCPVVWNGWGCDNSPCREDAMHVSTPEGSAAHFRVCDGCRTDHRFSSIVFVPIEEKQ